MYEIYKRGLKILSRITALQPLTFRGLLAVALSLISLHAFAVPEYDLVAYMLGGGCLAIVALAVISSIFLRIRLARNLRAEAFFSREENLSNTEISSGIVLHNCSLAPFFSLTVARRFEHPGANSPTHMLYGRAAPRGSSGDLHKRRLVDTICFPHRGVWKLDALEITLGDALGFTKLSGDLPLEASVEVRAPNIPIKPLPIVTASARSGDRIHHSEDRSGDMFDMKAYDPSDGIKRILWKTFARSGELVVRRPEPAIIPEGEVAVYLIANKDEDFVVGALQSYLEELKRNQIQVLFGTDGIASALEPTEAALGDESLFCSAPEQIQHAINLSAWSPMAGSGQGFGAYLEALSLQNRMVARVIVFAPNRLDSDTKSSKWHEHISREASCQNTALIISLVPRSLASVLELPQDSNQLPMVEKLHTLFGNKASSSYSTKLLTSAAAQSGAEIMLCESAEQL